MRLLLVLLALAGSIDQKPRAAVADPPVAERRGSRAVGTPSAGRLVRGVALPARGPGWVTWDPLLKRSPSRAWRRHATDRTVRRTIRVLAAYRRAHPGAPPVAVGDMSRPRGGDFGPKYGLIGHASHQNGLDVDVYYPRRDRRVRPPLRAAQVDRRRAQWLADAFVRAGARLVLTGPSLGLRGRAGIVMPATGHDNHLHVRF